MIRADLNSPKPLQLVEAFGPSLFLFKSLDCALPSVTADIQKSMLEYTKGGLDAVAILGELLLKAVSPYGDTQLATGMTQRDEPTKPRRIGTRVGNVGAGPVAGAPNVSTPEHQLAAHKVLANHYLHNYYHEMSQRGAEAAAPHVARHFAHQGEVSRLEGQGVQDTPQHHADLYNHYTAKMHNKTVNPDPVQTDAPEHSMAIAHADHLTRMGHGQKVGEPEQREGSTAPRGPTRLYSGAGKETSFVGDPNIKERKAQLAAKVPSPQDVPSEVATTGQYKRPPQVPPVQAAPAKPATTAGGATIPFASERTVVGPKTGTAVTVGNKRTVLERSLSLLSSLMKSAIDIQKDYYSEYGNEPVEKFGQGKPKLPSLWPEHRQEKHIIKERSAKKQKQTEESLAAKSLCLLNDMLTAS